MEGAAAKPDSLAPSQDAVYGVFVEVGQDLGAGASKVAECA